MQSSYKITPSHSFFLIQGFMQNGEKLDSEYKSNWVYFTFSVINVDKFLNFINIANINIVRTLYFRIRGIEYLPKLPIKLKAGQTKTLIKHERASIKYHFPLGP
jgi:hypothetical protein